MLCLLKSIVKFFNLDILAKKQDVIIAALKNADRLKTANVTSCEVCEYFTHLGKVRTSPLLTQSFISVIRKLSTRSTKMFERENRKFNFWGQIHSNP